MADLLLEDQAEVGPPGIIIADIISIENGDRMRDPMDTHFGIDSGARRTL